MGTMPGLVIAAIVLLRVQRDLGTRAEDDSRRHAFRRQSDIAVAIKQGLDDAMRTYGYPIDQALVTDIQSDDKVEAAMNEINAAQAMFAHTIDSLKLKECGRRSRRSGVLSRFSTDRHQENRSPCDEQPLP
jgi:SPFH domain / Band 7 family